MWAYNQKLKMTQQREKGKKRRKLAYKEIQTKERSLKEAVGGR